MEAHWAGFNAGSGAGTYGHPGSLLPGQSWGLTETSSACVVAAEWHAAEAGPEGPAAQLGREAPGLDIASLSGFQMSTLFGPDSSMTRMLQNSGP